MQMITLIRFTRVTTYLNIHNLQWITRGLSCKIPYWDRKSNEEIKKQNIRYKRAANDRDKKETRKE